MARFVNGWNKRYNRLEKGHPHSGNPLKHPGIGCRAAGAASGKHGLNVPVPIPKPERAMEGVPSPISQKEEEEGEGGRKNGKYTEKGRKGRRDKRRGKRKRKDV